MRGIWKLDETINFCNSLVENEGFTVSILNAPGYGARGRLSTMGCIISKDGKSDVVELDTNRLIQIMKRTTLVNGEFQGTYSIASISGCKCIINPDMPEWLEAKKDMQEKNMPKTKRYVTGRNYKTISLDELYLGETYKVYDMHDASYYDQDKLYNRWVKLVPRKEKQKYYMMLDVNENSYDRKVHIYRNCKSMKELLSAIKSNFIASSGNNGAKIIKFVENKPSRIEGDIRLIDNATEEDWLDLYNTVLDAIGKDLAYSYSLANDDSMLCFSVSGELIDYSKYKEALLKAKITQE